MPELRINILTSEWVIIARERARRPQEFANLRKNRHTAEPIDSCPFCPGNEGKTPAEIVRLPSEGQWKIRVIPSKFPAVSAEGETTRTNEGLRHSVSGTGKHEVIIETPRHEPSAAFLEADELAGVISLYRDRFITAFEDRRVEHVIIFKNHGLSSGTTIQHPHSQLLAVPVKPLNIRMRTEEALRYYDNTGECLMCSIIRDEKQDGKRLVLETEHFITFIPYAALSPFHMWLFPKRHSPSFAEIAGDETRDLAAHLKAILMKLYHGLGNPDFNYVLHSERPDGLSYEHFHWYIGIIPRVIQSSGIELGSGIYINLSIPEEIAGFMRGIKADSP